MELIKDTVHNIIESLAKKQDVTTGGPADWLKKTLTKKELGHIKFNYFKKGILSINVDSSSWLYHLSLRKENLLAKLRAQSGNIKDIHFRIGEIK